ncbi:hypothetical protein QYF36_025338 [Acer negundo]|nr:hypothetical protein QYF36_025338 [Acer negundo]
MGISNIFNIEDLNLYYGHEDVVASNEQNARLPPTSRLKEEIEDVTDHQIVSTKEGDYQKYLVKWKARPLSECTWITDEEFQHMNHDLYERFHAFNTPGLSLSKPGGVDGDKWQTPLRVYNRKNKESKAQTLISHNDWPTWNFM